MAASRLRHRSWQRGISLARMRPHSSPIVAKLPLHSAPMGASLRKRLIEHGERRAGRLNSR